MRNAGDAPRALPAFMPDRSFKLFFLLLQVRTLHFPQGVSTSPRSREIARYSHFGHVCIFAHVPPRVVINNERSPSAHPNIVLKIRGYVLPIGYVNSPYFVLCTLAPAYIIRMALYSRVRCAHYVALTRDYVPGERSWCQAPRVSSC